MRHAVSNDIESAIAARLGGANWRDDLGAQSALAAVGEQRELLDDMLRSELNNISSSSLTIDALEQLAAVLYVLSKQNFDEPGDFFVLHLVTASHAARRLLARLGRDEFASMRQQLLTTLLSVFVALVVIRRPDLSEERWRLISEQLQSTLASKQSPQWDEIISSARKQLDAHTAKLAWVCLAFEHDKLTPTGTGAKAEMPRVDVHSPFWLAAARRLRLLSIPAWDDEEKPKDK
jgi:hypothetical protein